MAGQSIEIILYGLGMYDTVLLGIKLIKLGIASLVPSRFSCERRCVDSKRTVLHSNSVLTKKSIKMFTAVSFSFQNMWQASYLFVNIHYSDVHFTCQNNATTFIEHGMIKNTPLNTAKLNRIVISPNSMTVKAIIFGKSENVTKIMKLPIRIYADGRHPMLNFRF